MVWSLAKILLFVAAVALLAFGVNLLMETSGGVRIAVANREFTLSPLVALLGLAALMIAFWLALKVLGFLIATFRFLNGDETAVSRYFDRNRERRGFEALADGLMALASGEAKVAMAKASKAEKYLKRPELTNLITAQAAEIAGDTRKAQDTYKQLLTDERTRFVGVRGIMKQRLAEGDTDTALKLAEKAFALKPKHEETQDVLLQLQAQKEDWGGARKTLQAKLKHGSLPRDVHRRRDAVLALSEARDVLAEGQSIEAREAAIEANRLSPDLVPAAVMAARAYIENEKPKYATRVIKKAWDITPHPDLAAAFAAIEPDEAPDDRITRFKTLTRSHENDPETQMLLAELHIAAEDFPAARRSMGSLTETHPTARSLTLMAAIERGEGADDAVVQGWLTRALTASRGQQWVCDKCHHIHPGWTPTCENCKSFDTLSWTEAPQSEISMPAGVEMLPLIVGALEDKSKDVSIEDPDEVDPPSTEEVEAIATAESDVVVLEPEQRTKPAEKAAAES
ncbi:heme biosynthesis protein HemY [Litoreibacter roseus]|uniref:Heme biosynthesis protein HemY n=1 Tax=Litoreibacter roseus TaxID=2601869 RepID=A0A6N6JEY7_9RHOB|nr:heme biosynthesis HemY N-terminal domain-containing protein [Litoreibacter roseus]GFE64796.1 heme biosynthesis protein HemY [Litoreibacter roseus]